MAFLIQLDQPLLDEALIAQAGVVGAVVPVPSTDLQTGHFNASLRLPAVNLEVFCRIERAHFNAHDRETLWSQLQQLQTSLPFASLVLPFAQPALMLVQQAARLGWQWQIGEVRSVTQAMLALTVGAAGVWVEVGALDVQHEQIGDELCSQLRALVDDRFSQHSPKPLVVAADVRDHDHVERTLLYGCDRVVLRPSLFVSLVKDEGGVHRFTV